jgi:hypothetical protein
MKYIFFEVEIDDSKIYQQLQAQVDNSHHWIPQDTGGIGAFSREFQPFPGRKYTWNMEAVFRSEKYHSGNLSFPNIFRHRSDTGTCQFPAGNALERRCIHQELTESTRIRVETDEMHNRIFLPFLSIEELFA